jgi:probable rRNA maturation factor
LSVEVDLMIGKVLDDISRESLGELATLATEIVLSNEGKKVDDFEVSVLYTDDSFITQLNWQYRRVQGPTDVLSFPMMDPNSEIDKVEIPGVPNILGDIVISLETTRRQASEQGKSMEEELSLLLVHGVLHLLGYDHDSPEREAVMWDRQAKAVKEVLTQIKAIN